MTPASVLAIGCPHCTHLFGVLDLHQGGDGRPFRGKRELAEHVGWSHNTVGTHLAHLTARGLVVIEQQGHCKAIYTVANPARGVAAAATQSPGAGVADGATTVVQHLPHSPRYLSQDVSREARAGTPDESTTPPPDQRYAREVSNSHDDGVPPADDSWLDDLDPLARPLTYDELYGQGA